LEDHVELNKNFRTSYSKKQRIMEVILEKLDREGKELDKLMDKKR